MGEPPDAFAELHALAQSLEKRGAAAPMVIDALFRLWMGASVQYAGRDGVAISLREIAEEVEGLGNGLETPQPTAH
jgi:hypothetical protein